MKEVPWIPSPPDIIIRALRLAGVNKFDVVYDLGCGDGRVVTIAAKYFKSLGVCIEVDPILCSVARLIAEINGVSDSVEIVCGNYYELSLRGATVIYTYLFPSTLNKLKHKFEDECRPGTRIITLDFAISGWIPIAIRRVEDSLGITRTIRVYVIGFSDSKARLKRLDTPDSNVIRAIQSVIRRSG